MSTAVYPYKNRNFVCCFGDKIFLAYREHLWLPGLTGTPYKQGKKHFNPPTFDETSNNALFLKLFRISQEGEDNAFKATTLINYLNQHSKDLIMMHIL